MGIADRTRKRLQEILSDAKIAESRLSEVHDLLEELVDKMSDIDLTIFNAWIFLLVSDNMADALRHIETDVLIESLQLCDEEVIDKINLCLKKRLK